jgi:hypothetical protein
MGGGTRVGNGTTRHDTEGQGGCALARRRGTAAMGAVKGTLGSCRLDGAARGASKGGGSRDAA